ncbi:D-serine ammonia-lyase [Lachnospiraceae bacterium 54-53]
MNRNLLKRISRAEEVCWVNEKRCSFLLEKGVLPFHAEDIVDASARLDRFAPLIERLFPETETEHGLIESPLVNIRSTKEALSRQFHLPEGDLYLKCDSHLAIAGSVKARGGIYEVLKHTEDIAIKAGILSPGDDYSKLAEYKDFMSRYTIQVGSTGNLGMSIGIMSAALGYRAVVHMSEDAKEWKKELLRSKGVIVKEYSDDYGKAVSVGRKLSDDCDNSYFVDDEQSKDLFLGYAVAGERLKKQLDAENKKVDEKHPLFVYIPCGVGGAPGGITFGLKHIWGDFVHCFFVEPVQAPCMCIGMATGLENGVCVQDYGLTGKTQADGLAVSRASGLACKMMKHLVSGIFTIEDKKLYDYMRLLERTEHIIMEPSSGAVFEGYTSLLAHEDAKNYYDAVMEKADCPFHILWATGGNLMPEHIVRGYLE